MKIKLTQDASKALCTALAKITPRHKEVLRKLYVAPLGLTLELEPSKTEKTDSQRGYYWRSCQIAAKELGLSQDELHMVIKRECFGSEIVETKLGPVERIKSSEDAKRDEYSDLIETLIRCCAFAGHTVEPAREIAA